MTETQTLTLRRRIPSGHIVTAELEIRQPSPDGGGLSPGFSLTGTLGDGCTGAVGDRLAVDIPELAPFERLHLSDLDGVPMHAEANARYAHEQARGLREPMNDYGRAEREGLTQAEYLRRLACRTLRVDALPAELDTFSAETPDALNARARTLREDARSRERRGLSPKGIANTRDEANRCDEIAAELRAEGIPGDSSPYRVAFAAFVDAQRPRWKAEADEARAVFERLLADPRNDDVREWRRAHPLHAPEGEPESTRGLIDLASDHVNVNAGEPIDSRTLIDAQAAARLVLDDDDATPEERADARRLAALVDDLSDSSEEWQYGATLIPEGGPFEDYARELADDMGAVPDDGGWPLTFIDWPAAAAALAMDYRSVDIDGEAYLVR